MRELVAQYLSNSISRRRFVSRLVGTGISLTAAQSVLQSLTPLLHGQDGGGGVHNRGISALLGSRMVETGHFVQDYLGNPDMNMASIAHGFGVAGEVVHSPAELKEALARARRATLEGKPYLIDAQTARTGVAWAKTPWTPTIDRSPA